MVGTSYGDGSPGISRSYTLDGLLASISANGSTWTYGYNRRRLLQQETLSYGGSSYGIGRSDDANGHLSQLAYPDGSAVSYSPNALGQPSQASGYASAVSWHPNGALAGFTYVNGIAHTLTQNTRGLPQQSTDAGVSLRPAGQPAHEQHRIEEHQPQQGMTTWSMRHVYRSPSRSPRRRTTSRSTCTRMP